MLQLHIQEQFVQEIHVCFHEDLAYHLNHYYCDCQILRITLDSGNHLLRNEFRQLVIDPCLIETIYEFIHG